jgi:hypothetical protein
VLHAEAEVQATPRITRVIAQVDAREVIEVHDLGVGIRALLVGHEQVRVDRGREPQLAVEEVALGAEARDQIVAQEAAAIRIGAAIPAYARDERGARFREGWLA